MHKSSGVEVFVGCGNGVDVIVGSTEGCVVGVCVGGAKVTVGFIGVGGIGDDVQVGSIAGSNGVIVGSILGVYTGRRVDTLATCVGSGDAGAIPGNNATPRISNAITEITPTAATAVRGK